MKLSTFHPNVRIRIYMNFATSLMFNMVIPFMSVYFAAKAGAAAAGLMLALSILFSFASGFVGGYLADKIGRKKLIVLSEAAFLFAYAVMAIANSPWFDWPWATFAMMLLINISWGIYGPADDAMLLDVSTPETRKFMYSLFYWSNNLCIAVGGAIGALLFRHYLFELFAALVVATFISLWVTVFFIKETYVPHTHEYAGIRSWKKGAVELAAKYKVIFLDNTFMIYILASLLVLSVEMHLTNYIGIRLSQEMTAHPFIPWGTWLHSINGLEMLGFLRTENTLLVVVFSIIAAKIMSRYKDKNVQLAGFVLYVSGYSVLGFSNSPWLLLGAMVLATWGEVMYVPIKQAWLGDIAPEHARSAYMAVNSFVFKGANLIAAFAVTIGGYLPSWSMAAFMLVTGMAGTVLFAALEPRLNLRRSENASASILPQDDAKAEPLTI